MMSDYQYHKDKAEALLDMSRMGPESINSEVSLILLHGAQVHATLALAAATKEKND